MTIIETRPAFPGRTHGTARAESRRDAAERRRTAAIAYAAALEVLG